jgi:hypothetical protein
MFKTFFNPSSFLILFSRTKEVGGTAAIELQNPVHRYIY